MNKYHFEVEERHLYRFDINANDRNQAIRIFTDHASLYMKDNTTINGSITYRTS